MQRTTFAALGLAVLVSIPALAFASPGDPDGRGPRAARATPLAAPHGPWARRLARFRHRAGHVLRTLDLSAEQKASLKASREAAAPVRDDLAAKVRAIVADARRGERTPETRAAARAKVKAAIASARQAVEPSATRFVGTLSADQKGKLAEKAKAHGRAFDEARLVKLVEGVLVTPKDGTSKGHRHAHRWGRR